MKSFNEWYRKLNSFSNPERINGVEREWAEKIFKMIREESMAETIKHYERSRLRWFTYGFISAFVIVILVKLILKLG